jgi:hypothetical protein
MSTTLLLATALPLVATVQIIGHHAFIKLGNLRRERATLIVRTQVNFSALYELPQQLHELASQLEFNATNFIDSPRETHPLSETRPEISTKYRGVRRMTVHLRAKQECAQRDMELLSPPTTFDVQTAAAFINAMTFDSAHIDTVWDDRRKVHLTTSNLFPVAWLYKNHPLRCSNCDKNWKPSNHKRWQNLQDDRDVIFVLLRNGTFEATKHDPGDLDPYNSEVVCQERTKKSY